MRILALTLALTLALAAAPALAQGGLVDDVGKVRDSFFYKTYTGMLGNEAANGDRWSTLRLREIDRAVTMADAAKKYKETSWWNPIDKISAGYGAWRSSNQYFDAAADRRAWEKKLADAGITPSGKRREEAAEAAIKFAGIFSGAAREGGKLIDQMKKAEDSAFTYHTTSWLNPVEKYNNGRKAIQDSADADLLYRNFKNVAANDPFVRFGESISGIASTLGDLLGGGNRTGSRDIYAGGARTTRTPGRITDDLSGGLGLDALTRDLSRATADLKRSFEEIKLSIRGMKRELSNGLAEIGRQAGAAANGCTGPNCPPASERVNVNGVLDRLMNKGIR